MENTQGSNQRGSLHKLLKPTLVFLSIAGCYGFSKSVDNTLSHKTNRNTSKWKILGIIYRFFCFLCCIMLCLKGCIAITTEERKMNFQILFLLWYFQCMVNFLIFLKADCTRFGQLQKVMQFWDCRIIPAMKYLQIDLNMEKIRKWQKIYVIVGVGLALINIISLGIICSPIFSEDNRYQYVAPFQYSGALLILVLILTIPLIFLWVFPVLSVMTISKLLTTAFEGLNKFLEKHLSKTLQSKTCKLYQLRLLHLNLCKMVTDLDNDLGYYYASTFVFSIGISCYILYQVIKFSMSTMNQCVFVMWLVSHLGFLSANSVAAACVSQAAHGSLDTLYYLCIPDINKEQLAHLNLFLSKLTGSPVGFTTAGLLTITKDFLLTITGVFLTYFFLLYTFPQQF